MGRGWGREGGVGGARVAALLGGDEALGARVEVVLELLRRPVDEVLALRILLGVCQWPDTPLIASTNFRFGITAPTFVFVGAAPMSSSPA